MTESKGNVSISPLTGRYTQKTIELWEFFSEFAFIKYRIRIEIEYLIKLRQTIPELKDWKDIQSDDELRQIYKKISSLDIETIKRIETQIKHDVKSIEYYIKKKVPDRYKEFVHFALTSQDVNNPAISLSVKECLEQSIYPKMVSLIGILKKQHSTWKDIAILSRTHGQPASPTTMGKEIRVFMYRLENEIEVLNNIRIYTKFGGAVGNFNAHNVAYPDIDWERWADDFITEVSSVKTSEVYTYQPIIRSKYTTQIDNYDSLSRIFDSIKRICTILTDMCQDMWLYISFNYFKLMLEGNQIGSSTMPHKVNPINFENAEGNFKLCSNIAQFLSLEMPVSRLQRDLTDSTLSRNIGTVFGHLLIGLDSLLSGLSKLDINTQQISQDLDNNAIVIGEAIQTILRKEGIDEPYEKIKALTQNKPETTLEDIHNFIKAMKLDKEVEDKLLKITPHNYIGII